MTPCVAPRAASCGAAHSECVWGRHPLFPASISPRGLYSPRRPTKKSFGGPPPRGPPFHRLGIPPCGGDSLPHTPPPPFFGGLLWPQIPVGKKPCPPIWAPLGIVRGGFPPNFPSRGGCVPQSNPLGFLSPPPKRLFPNLRFNPCVEFPPKGF